MNNEYEDDRSLTLLRACLDLLNQYKESPYELEILSKTIEYDGSECDGYCLIDDLEDYIFITDVLNNRG